MSRTLLLHLIVHIVFSMVYIIMIHNDDILFCNSQILYCTLSLLIKIKKIALYLLYMCIQV